MHKQKRQQKNPVRLNENYLFGRFNVASRCFLESALHRIDFNILTYRPSHPHATYNVQLTEFTELADTCRRTLNICPEFRATPVGLYPNLIVPPK